MTSILCREYNDEVAGDYKNQLKGNCLIYSLLCTKQRLMCKELDIIICTEENLAFYSTDEYRFRYICVDNKSCIIEFSNNFKLLFDSKYYLLSKESLEDKPLSFLQLYLQS
jgi:hypothetical protein